LQVARKEIPVGVKKIIFTLKVSQMFEQVSGEAVKSSSVEVLRAELGKALSSLIQIGRTLNEELGKVVSRGPFKAT